MAIYYCATTGDDDTGDGSISNPWGTWDKLGNSLSPGDTGYIRGGTYTTFVYGQQHQCRWNGLSGTAENPIIISAYQDEIPIWDLNGVTLHDNSPSIIQMNQCDYVHVKHLRITNCAQPGVSPVLAWNIINSQHCTIEWCTVDHIGGFGFLCGFEGFGGSDLNIETSNYNLFLNCDAHDCADPTSPSPYDGSNGFNLMWNGNAEVGNPWFPNTTFRGCRSWYNSDDGWDCFLGQSHPIYWENCWSFWNGYVNGIPNYEGAIGVGFKLGPLPDHSLDSTFMGSFKNCIAAQNTHSGFSGNYSNETFGAGIFDLYNCLSYNNSVPNPPGGGLGIWFTAFAEPNPLCTIKNSISIMNGDDTPYWNQVNDNHGGDWIESNNTWNFADGPFPPNMSLTQAQCIDLDNFVSLDVSQLAGARKSDGSLPDITFGHLAEGSPLIGAGVDVGLLTDGEGKPYLNPPSIGAYEYGSSTLQTIISKPNIHGWHTP